MSPFVLLGTFSLAIFKSFALAGGGGSGAGGGGGGFSGGSSYGGYSSGSSSASTGGSGWVLLFVFLGVMFIFWLLLRAAAKKQGGLGVVLGMRQLDDSKLDENQKFAKDTFVKFQKDWSAFDLDSMKGYMTDHYYQHNLLMMGALKLAARQNQVDNIKVYTVTLMNQSPAGDAFTAALWISATDITNDTRTNTQLFKQFVRTTQYYKFKKIDGRWLLDGVDNITQDPSQMVGDMQQLADSNGYFYSLDWGWLLLPKSGQLFKGGKFGASDINNHVIGVIGQTIFQLYTYTPYSTSEKYLVAQTAVPKDYGNIFVRPNKLIDVPPKGMTKVSLEWGDFNKKYDVFATDMERVTSFELLNPSFMEKLEALPFHMSIEVADNVVYLYSTDSKLGVSDYQAMLDILKDAFKEMRM